MNIGFVCNEYPLAPHGGIGTFVRTIALQLVKLDQDITVVGFDQTVKRTEWQEDHGIRVLRVRSPFRPVPRIRMGHYGLDLAFWGERMYLSRLLKYITKKHRIELIESHDWSGPLWNKPPVPLVVRLHGANTAYQLYENKKPSKVLRFVERHNVAMADSLVAVSRHIGRLTLKALNLNDRDFDVIYNGIDTDLFHPSDFPRDSLEVLYVGSLTRRKGIYALLQAIPEILRMVPKAHFKIVGPLPAGEPGKQRVHELLSVLPESLHGSVEFVGYMPHHELPAVYSHATVAVFPSFAEAFGLTCAEAMACGTSVVITSRASGPELVEHEVSGLLIDPGDPKELAVAIARLLKDGVLRRKLSNNALKRAQDMFAISRLSKNNLTFYKKVRDRYYL